MPASIQPHAIATADAHSYQVQDILGRAPNWILRWGITAIGVCLVLFLLLAWAIKYPDIIEAPVSITGTNPAALVVAQQDGHLEKLFVTENQTVAQGALLAVIKSPADAERVFRIKADAEKLRPFLTDALTLPGVTLSDGGQLGRLQTSYSDLFGGYTQYQRMLADDYVAMTVTTLNHQLERKQSQVANMREQLETTEKELQIARGEFESMKALHDCGTLSRTDLSKHVNGLLEKQRQHSTVEKTLLEEEIASAGYDKEIRDLRHQRELELREASTALREALKQLLSDVEIWENEYLLRAPVADKVAFYEFWTDQRYVKKGDHVFIIAPETSALLARIEIKTNGAGKIAAGQDVRIKLNDFPHGEFGMVTEELNRFPRSRATVPIR